MDELWQRYRSFLTPVLIGLGVFLVGLIVVHTISDDPDAWSARVTGQARVVGKKIEPASSKINAQRKNREALEERVKDWSARLDQGDLATGADEILDVIVSATLRAAILRGLDPQMLATAVANPEAASTRQLLVPFDGDAVAAGKALARYESVRQDRLNLLRTGDPNVGFSRLLSDVLAEIRVRANRADVELHPDALGHAGVTSVTRAVLAQRLLNLARISEILDLAIRERVRAIVEVRIEQKLNPLGEDVFLREWPFTVVLRGDMVAIRPVLAWLTDPENPLPIHHLEVAQPPRSSPLEGQAQLTVKAASVLVRPDVALGLDTEEVR